jgi:peptidoglycan hydrolase CwlO-like protein
VRAAADTAEQLRQQLATQVSAVSQLQAAKRELESQLAGVEAGDKGAAAEADAMAARRALALAEQCAAEQTAQHEYGRTLSPPAAPKVDAMSCFACTAILRYLFV